MLLCVAAIMSFLCRLRSHSSSNSFLLSLIYLFMGNQCCQQGRTGDFVKANLSKFQYTFQEDTEELPNPILSTSTFATRSPPNEFTDREECQLPKVSREVQDLLGATTLASMTSALTDRGEGTRGASDSNAVEVYTSASGRMVCLMALGRFTSPRAAFTSVLIWKECPSDEEG